MLREFWNILASNCDLYLLHSKFPSFESFKFPKLQFHPRILPYLPKSDYVICARPLIPQLTRSDHFCMKLYLKSFICDQILQHNFTGNRRDHWEVELQFHNVSKHLIIHCCLGFLQYMIDHHHHLCTSPTWPILHHHLHGDDQVRLLEQHGRPRVHSLNASLVLHLLG